jgi:hypothetical protein
VELFSMEIEIQLFAVLEIAKEMAVKGVGTNGKG